MGRPHSDLKGDGVAVAVEEAMMGGSCVQFDKAVGDAVCHPQ